MSAPDAQPVAGRDDRDPVLPQASRDERDPGWGDEREDGVRDEEWYRRERPPHHG